MWVDRHTQTQTQTTEPDEPDEPESESVQNHRATGPQGHKTMRDSHKRRYEPVDMASTQPVSADVSQPMVAL